jgi:hypothetical protein
LRLIQKLQLQAATGILKETSCVSNPHFLTIMCDDVKTSMCFKFPETTSTIHSVYNFYCTSWRNLDFPGGRNFQVFNREFELATHLTFHVLGQEV